MRKYQVEVKVNLTAEFKKVNELVLGSSLNDNSVTPNNGGMRSLLGNCGSPYDRCDNDCFGMCGNACEMCWRIVCGDCDCWLGCEKHDEYCSCEGLWHPCCVDIFWVRCDGSESCPWDIDIDIPDISWWPW